MERRNSWLILSVSLVFLLTVVGLATALLWRGHADAVARAEIQVTAAAGAVAAQASWLLEAGGQTLRRAEQAMASDRPAQAFAQVAADLPPGFELSVHDGDGQLVFPLDATDATADSGFIDLDAGAFTPDIGISAFVPELSGGVGGFYVRRTIGEDQAGRTILLHVPAGLLSEFWRTLALGPDSAISIFREDGLLVARHPVPTGSLDLSDHPLFAEHLLLAPSGVYHSSESPADGVPRIVGYTTVAGKPLVAVAALSTAHALGPYWQRLYALILLGLPVLIILAALAWWQAVLLRREEATRRKLEATADHNHMLLREVHHRVKNNLQIIMSMVRMQKLPAEAELDLRNRVMAMSALHEHLHGPGPAGLVELGTYLGELMEGVNSSYGNRMKLVLDFEPDIFVDADAATPLGLIVNELVTNANKYAFPDGEFGTMTVQLARRGGTAEVAVLNDGIPFDATPKSKGEGIRLIRSLAPQVSTDFVLTGDKGLEFRIKVPITDRPTEDLSNPDQSSPG